MPTVDLPPIVAASPFVGVVGAGDPGSSRLVYAMVIGLVVVGIVLILLAIWILRQTRPDLDVLAPLERMGDSDWKKRDPSTQRRMLDDVRPEGAQPLAAEPPPPPIDSDFEQADHAVTSFNDLGPGLGGAVLDTAPPELEAGGIDASSDDPAHAPAAEAASDSEGDPAEAPDDDAEAESAGEDLEGDPAEDLEGDPAEDLEGDPAEDLEGDPADESADDLVDGPADHLEDEATDTSVGDSSSDPRE